MRGEPIINAKSALELFLHSLPYDSYFEIVGFGYKYSPLFHTLVEYNDTTLEMAIKHVHSIEADMKGTEMLQPLKYILEQKPDHLILLTDGAVSNVDELKSYCSQFTTQISTIAIGNYAAKDLLQTISLRSMGTYESVDYVGQIEGAVIRSLSAMENGVLITSIKSNCGILYQTFPVLLLPDTISVFRFFNQNSYSQENVSIDLIVQDLSCQKEFSFTINQDNAIVKRIEGKKLHCTTLLRAINENIIDGDEAFNESIRLGLLTEQTSFILVDKRSASDKE